MIPAFNISNIAPDATSQMSMPTGLPVNSQGSIQSEGGAFEEELSGEQQKLSSNNRENNSQSNTLYEKEGSEEKNTQKSPENGDMEGRRLEKESHGTRHAMLVGMPVLTTVSPEVDPQGQVAEVDAEANYSSSVDNVFDKTEATPLAGKEIILSKSISVTSKASQENSGLVEAGKSGSSNLDQTAQPTSQSKATRQEAKEVLVRVNTDSAKHIVRASKVSGEVKIQAGTDVLQPVLVAPSRPAVSETKSPVETKQLEQLTKPAADNLLQSVDDSSVAKHREEPSENAAPATVREKSLVEKTEALTSGPSLLSASRTHTDGTEKLPPDSTPTTRVSQSTVDQVAPLPVRIANVSETSQSKDVALPKEGAPISGTVSEKEGRLSETARQLVANARSSESNQVKESSVPISVAPRGIAERTAQPARTPVAPTTGRVVEATQSKEFQAANAAETTPSTISTTSRSKPGVESSRNATASSLQTGAVASRPASKDSQPTPNPNRKGSRKGKADFRTRNLAGHSRFVQSSIAAGSPTSGAPQGIQSTPGAIAAQVNRTAFSQLAEWENANSDSSSKESTGRISRDEGTGNISATGNTQRSEMNANPRSANVQTFFSRINEGVEQLKSDKLNSIQLRMTLDQGQSVRIHLNLRGQSLKTIIFTDSDSLRAAFRDGWEGISRALSEKGVDANELQFSLNDDGKSSAQDNWEERDLREKEFATSAIKQAGGKPVATPVNLSSEAGNGLEASTNRFTRFA